MGQNRLIVRILVIDNVDSFTGNLVHDLALSSGSTPVVVRNDVPYDALPLDQVDAVVLSAGPGRPDRPADFGVCRDVLLRSTLPVLGVCLGHQGIADVFGGTVDLAPEPRHGRLSTLTHDGTGVFQGLPDPFTVVRYHSLAVTSLPEDLVANAWSEDGVIMGVRHRRRPVHGVQFHPESIATEHGRTLIDTFLRLVSSRRGDGGAVGGGGGRERPVSPPDPAEYSVEVDRLDGLVDPRLVHEYVRSPGAASFWLDSSDASTASARFSYLGPGDGPHAEFLTYDHPTARLTVLSRSEAVTSRVPAFFDAFAERLRARRIVDAPDLPFDFAFGAVGYLGYELKAETGGTARHIAETPDAAWLFPDRLVVLDHRDRNTWVLSLRPEGYPPDDWHARTIDVLRKHLAHPSRRPDVATTSEIAGSPIRARFDDDAYRDAVDRCRRLIELGETYEVCLTNRFEVPVDDLDPLAVHLALREVSPAPYAALVEFPGVTIVSSSPERFLRVTRDGTVLSKPIKGTRRRGATPAEDAAAALDLAQSEKDRAENLMVVDLVRHDLSTVCEPGSVRVPTLFGVESFARVHQLVSTVTGKLTPDHDAVDAVRAAFPGGSMTGAPKVRTMGIIDDLEGGPRGVYSGALGWFSLDGAADLAMVIRSIVIADGVAAVGSGGAVVAQSSPADELAEMHLKAEVLLSVLRSVSADHVGATADHGSSSTLSRSRRRNGRSGMPC